MWKTGPQGRRINLVAILAAFLAIVSLAFPWWGIAVTNLGGGSLTWGPGTGPASGGAVVFFQSDQLNSGFEYYSDLLLLLVLGTVVLAGIGSLLEKRIILALGLVLSIITVLVFLVDVNGAVGQACATLNPAFNCISGLYGSGRSPGTLSSINWGFESGYYLFIISILVLTVALVLHKSKITIHLAREHTD